MKFYLAVCLIVGFTAAYGQHDDTEFDAEQFQQGIQVLTQKLNERCVQISGNEEIIFEIMHGLENVQKCFATIMEEIEGESVEEAFKSKDPRRMVPAMKNHCRKRSLAFGCVKHLAKTVEVCMEPDEIAVLNIFARVIKKALVFFCENDGANVSEFITNDGPECIAANKDTIERCGSNAPNTFMSMETGAINQIEYEQCREYDTVKGCIYDALAYCPNDYAATFVDDFLTAIKTELPC